MSAHPDCRLSTFGIIRDMKVIAVTCALMCASALGGVMPQLDFFPYVNCGCR